MLRQAKALEAFSALLEASNPDELAKLTFGSNYTEVFDSMREQHEKEKLLRQFGSVGNFSDSPNVVGNFVNVTDAVGMEALLLHDLSNAAKLREKDRHDEGSAKSDSDENGKKLKNKKKRKTNKENTLSKELGSMMAEEKEGNLDSIVPFTSDSNEQYMQVFQSESLQEQKANRLRHTSGEVLKSATSNSADNDHSSKKSEREKKSTEKSNSKSRSRKKSKSDSSYESNERRSKKRKRTHHDRRKNSRNKDDVIDRTTTANPLAIFSQPIERLPFSNYQPWQHQPRFSTAQVHQLLEQQKFAAREDLTSTLSAKSMTGQSRNLIINLLMTLVEELLKADSKHSSTKDVSFLLPKARSANRLNVLRKRQNVTKKNRENLKKIIQYEDARESNKDRWNNLGNSDVPTDSNSTHRLQKSSSETNNSNNVDVDYQTSDTTNTESSG